MDHRSTTDPENENRIRAAMDRLLRGEIPPGGTCDVKTLVRESAVDRTAFYGTRPYAHLREEFEHRLRSLHAIGDIPDPRDAQIARLAAQHEEIVHLRATATAANRVTLLPLACSTSIGSCS
ncbi:hypothetical protein ACFV30_33995 [Streptomyces sp. NPDC059752]|uniref:hypothetical protein n=1 Tax=unclassified Streptomyces TaxID=2593676 RepID=UPI00364B65E6